MFFENTPAKITKLWPSYQGLKKLFDRGRRSHKKHPPLVEAVARFYKKFTYPKYPLLFRPRWQEGYLAASGFIRALAQGLHIAPSISLSEKHILIAGSGEILPLIMRKQEGRLATLTCVDLSAESHQRARLRLLRFGMTADFVTDDLNQVLKQSIDQRQHYTHVDAYGVLHHMPNPTGVLNDLSKALAMHGGLRLMVYNSAARNWIHQIQSAFKALNIDAYNKQDLALARKIVKMLPRYSASIKEKLGGMGASIINNDARFADTFLHPREARIPITQWFSAIDKANFHCLGLFDRYGELDDLPNPLWKLPSPEELERRAELGDFANNLELFLIKKPDVTAATSALSVSKQKTSAKTAQAVLDLSKALSMPPKFWCSFEETENLSHLTMQKIWSAHLAHTHFFPRMTLDLSETLNQLSISSIKRLARIGALLPQMIPKHLHEAALQPLRRSATSMPGILRISLHNTELAELLKNLFYERNLHNEKRYLIAIKRLERALA
jgi:2-polyprenyl-3-methyl-5-hydroxy-6-metoxy-1,4-benzoquinol methylase